MTVGIDEIYVRDKNLNKIGLIENAESIIWTNRYFECGDFEIYAPASKKTLNLCKIGRFLTHNDSNVPMIIEEYKITTDLDGIDYITISGRCATAILARRVIFGTTAKRPEEYASLRIRELITHNAIMPTEIYGNSVRRIDKLKFSESLLYPDEIEYESGEYEGQNLYKAVTDICKQNGFGIKVQLEFPQGTTNIEKENTGFLNVVLYNGLDQSKDQDEFEAVVFSPSHGNLAESEYGVSWTNYANSPIAFAKTGAHAGTVSSFGQASGLDRYEISVDVSDIDASNVDSEYEYTAMSRTRAYELISNYKQNVAFDGKVVFSESYTYKIDYDLGDIVTMENEYGATETLRVVEVIESLDSNGYVITPILKGVTEITN